MKKVLIVLGCLIILIGVGFITFKSKYNAMSKYLSEYSFKEIDLQSISDGTYSGNCKVFLVSVDLSVKVEGHRIVDISINKQDNGKGYEGRQVIDHVLKEQSLKVDAKTGATGSSKCILIALERALQSKK